MPMAWQGGCCDKHVQRLQQLPQVWSTSTVHNTATESTDWKAPPERSTGKIRDEQKKQTSLKGGNDQG